MGVWAGVSAVVRVPISKPRPRSVAPSCGGVTERTAPNPPTVPAAISRKRFMLYLGSSIRSGKQMLRHGIYSLGHLNFQPLRELRLQVELGRKCKYRNQRISALALQVI